MLRMSKIASALFIASMVLIYGGGIGVITITQNNHIKEWETARVETVKLANAELHVIDSAAKHDGMSGIFKTCTRQVSEVRGMYLVCEVSQSPITYRGQSAPGELTVTTFANREDAMAYIAGTIPDDFMWNQYRRVRASFTAG